jgi:NADPH2:quinone reductase
MCAGTYAFRPPAPFVPGQEICGVVEAAGDGAGPAPGERLMAVTSFYDGHGGFAEVALARAASSFRVPETMDDAEAAGFRIGYSTAWIGLVRRGRLQAGETVLVLGGAGGTGATAIQVAVALGATVIAVASGPDKGAFCAALGAHAVIDRSRQAVAETAMDLTGGRGVDVVVDPVGGPLAAATVGCLARDGRLLAVGFASGSWVKPSVWELVRRNASIVGVYAGGQSRADDEADHEALLALWEAGRLRSVVREVGFERLPEAVQALADGTAIGKYVTRPLPVRGQGSA